MRAKKVIAHILAVLPLVLLASGFILEIIFRIGVQNDAVYWREHFISLISAVLLIAYPFYALPCVYGARWINRSVESGFANAVTWIDIFAVLLPIIYYCVFSF